MGPTTRSHTGDEWDTKVTQLYDDVSEIKQTLGDLDQLKKCFQDMDDIKNNLQAISQHLGLLDKGKHPEYHSEAPHSSHYENTHNSHSPWGSPNSWNNCQKWRCINLMDLTQLGGSPKWNTTSPSMIFRMMRPNSM
jgi:hypothetical protein